VDGLADRGVLAAGLSRRRAVDRAWMLTSVEIYLGATDGCGWSDAEYAAWLASLLVNQLLTGGGKPPGPGRGPPGPRGARAMRPAGYRGRGRPGGGAMPRQLTPDPASARGVSGRSRRGPGAVPLPRRSAAPPQRAAAAPGATDRAPPARWRG